MRILMVEDDADTAQSMAWVLNRSGHETCWVSSGNAAVGLPYLHYNVVLLDISIPDMNGYDVARTLKDRPKPPFVIAITGHGGSDALARSEAAGIDLHLLKPVDVDELLRVLNKLPDPVFA